MEQPSPIGTEMLAPARSIPKAPPGLPTPDEITDLVTFIARRFHPRRVVLFGSRAYGTPTPDSDVDLLVVMDTPGRPIEQAVRIRQAIELPHPYPLDIIVRTPAQIELGLAEGDFFIREIVENGVTLFEAGDARLAGQG